MRRSRFIPRRQSWRAAPRVSIGRRPRSTRRVRSLLPRSYPLISPVRIRTKGPVRTLERSRIVRGFVRPSFSSLVNSFLLPRGDAFAARRSVKSNVCESKQERRESLFARGVAGSSWKRINMRNAHHDKRRC